VDAPLLQQVNESLDILRQTMSAVAAGSLNQVQGDFLLCAANGSIKLVNVSFLLVGPELLWICQPARHAFSRCSSISNPETATTATATAAAAAVVAAAASERRRNGTNDSTAISRSGSVDASPSTPIPTSTSERRLVEVISNRPKRKPWDQVVTTFLLTSAEPSSAKKRSRASFSG